MPSSKNRWASFSDYRSPASSTQIRLLLERLIEMNAQLHWVNDRLEREGICSICFMREIAECDSDLDHPCVEGNCT